MKRRITCRRRERIGRCRWARGQRLDQTLPDLRFNEHDEPMQQVHEQMFRSAVLRHRGNLGWQQAALALAGFLPRFHVDGGFPSLDRQLREFGGGIEVSLLAAAPKGSGLGTSSILVATALATLGDLCGLNWDRNVLFIRTLALEPLPTSGGGWQDQADIEEIIRDHGSAIENGTHHRRDVTFGEGACRTADRPGAEVLASLRNLAKGLYELERARERTKVDPLKSRCPQQTFSGTWTLRRR